MQRDGKQVAFRGARNAFLVMSDDNKIYQSAVSDGKMTTREALIMVCEALEKSPPGTSVRTICVKLGISRSLIFLYADALIAKGKDLDLVDRFKQAQHRLVDAAQYEIEDIADGKDLPAAFEDSGTLVARARLRVETRKWNYSKIMPRTLGDKVDKEDSDEPTKVVIVGGLPDES